MYLDKETLFSHNQAVTAAGPATDVVDLGPGDAGPSDRLSLVVTAGPCTGGGTLMVALQTAASVNASGTLAAPVTVAEYTVSAASLAAGGTLVAARLPHGMKRYAALTYTPGGALTGCSLTAGLVFDVQAA